MNHEPENPREEARRVMQAVVFTTEDGRMVAGLRVRGCPWMWWDPCTKHAYCERCGTVTEVTRGLIAKPDAPFGALVHPIEFGEAWGNFVQEHGKCVTPEEGVQ